MNVFHSITMARASLPRLTLAQRVVDKMVRNALIYDTETGEALVGFAVKTAGRAEPDLYVIETIAPDESAVRQTAYFEQGDDPQSQIFYWWFDNWNQYRERRRVSYGSAMGAKWDVPLVHLGDWHKHPSTLIEPSWGDTDTAHNHISDPDTATPQLLAILATVWDKQRSDAFDESSTDAEIGQPKPIKVPIDAHTVVRLDCWYMSRQIRRFARLSPVVVPDKSLPGLPIISWHLSQPERVRYEVEVMSAEGYAVSMEQSDVDKQPPLKYCVMLAKGKKVWIAVTEPNYPATRPTLRSAPSTAIKTVPEEADFFQSMLTISQPIPDNAYPDWTWTSDRTILDLIHAVEAKLPEGSAVL
ncbi:MAG: hypothetical protein ABI947_13525 [Chloroflexota bacterium]